jgi:hypothetical protein
MPAAPTHTITAEIDVVIAEQEGVCEANKPEEVSFTLPEDHIAHARGSSKSTARTQGRKA